jgi:hypothetical protein
LGSGSGVVLTYEKRKMNRKIEYLNIFFHPLKFEKMKNVSFVQLAISVTLTLCFSCTQMPNAPSKKISPIDGNWEKVSTVINGKLTTPQRKPAEFKMFNDGYFSLIHYNDDGSSLGFAGAGVFELNSNHYKETYKYAHDTTLIGASVWFDWYMEGDTLVFTGFKKVILPDGTDVTKDWGGDTWVEKRVRAK